MSSKEVTRGCANVITMTATTVRVENTQDSQLMPPRDFTFDHCYFSDSTQDQVYQDLGQPLLSQAMDGFNGTIFAYGQTGSGKSFSMTGGSEENRGIIPRLNENLWKMTSERLEALKEAEEGDTKYMITVQYLFLVEKA